MKSIYITIVSFLSLILLNGCGATAYSYPNYKIIKPTVSYKPKRDNIKKQLNKHLNKPYVWAEEGPHAFDCSGLTYNIYGKMGVELPRVAREQAKVGKKVELTELAYGDLLFFGSRSKRSKRINHVGIYIGNGWFAHASSADRKVTFNNLNLTPSYMKRLKVCRRYLSHDERQLYLNADVPVQKYKTTSTAYTTPWQPHMKVPTKIPS
jgi:hypothetical protein